MKNLISVIGGGSCAPEDYARAREVGRLLAERDYVVVTGGLGGVMEAAHRGAREAGGLTIAVLPGIVREEANPFAEIVLTTGMADARNVIVATSGRVAVAVDRTWQGDRGNSFPAHHLRSRIRLRRTL